MPSEKLVVEGVDKRFRVRGSPGTPDTTLQVLKNVSLSVAEGEVVSLIGESGCGKTTLLRIIQGLIKLDSGSIMVDGHAVSGPGRDRGFVFQQSSLAPWSTAEKNVEFGLELAGVPKKTRSEQSARLLKLVGLSHAAHQYPHELSGGMQQRVNLARALAIDPAILLMDEPFSALDAQTREVLQEELLRIQSETKMTVLFVTHDLDEAIYLSNRIVVLGARPGRVKKVIHVPFPRDRGDLPSLRGDPHFQAIRKEIGELIKNQPAGVAA
jgi:NitT/TauT family transport system ATP-binding protein